jgi:hypothetical protein
MNDQFWKEHLARHNLKETHEICEYADILANEAYDIVLARLMSIFSNL